jgi:hypothetical protein
LPASRLWLAKVSRDGGQHRFGYGVPGCLGLILVQDEALERIKLHYRGRSNPRIDKKDLIQKAVDLLVAKFNKDKDFLLTEDK